MVQAPGQRGAQVVVLGVEHGQPGDLIGGRQVRLGPLGQRQAPGQMPASRLLLLARLRQPLGGVLAHRLQQPAAHLPAGLLVGHQQRLVDEAGQ